MLVSEEKVLPVCLLKHNFFAVGVFDPYYTVRKGIGFGQCGSKGFDTRCQTIA